LPAMPVRSDVPGVLIPVVLVVLGAAVVLVLGAAVVLLTRSNPPRHQQRTPVREIRLPFGAALQVQVFGGQRDCGRQLLGAVVAIRGARNVVTVVLVGPGRHVVCGPEQLLNLPALGVLECGEGLHVALGQVPGVVVAGVEVLAGNVILHLRVLSSGAVPRGSRPAAGAIAVVDVTIGLAALCVKSFGERCDAQQQMCPGSRGYARRN